MSGMTLFLIKKEFGIWEKEYEGDQDIRNESFFITAVNRKIKI